VDERPALCARPVRYEQLPKEILEPDLLEKIITWKPGTPWEQARLDKLRESLARLDYFSGIDIAPEPEKAKDGVMPVKISSRRPSAASTAPA
jgi:translocation and assembly module TamA